MSALVFELVEPFAGLFPLVVDEPADELLPLLFELAAGLFPLILEPVAGLLAFTDVEPFVGLLLLVFELAVGLLVFAVELSAGLLVEPFVVFPVVPAGFVIEFGLLFVEPLAFEPVAGLLWLEPLLSLLLAVLDAGLLVFELVF